MNTFKKHISEVSCGDIILFNGDMYTATTDAYTTKTDIGKEWNVEVDGDGPETYIYASSVAPDCMVEIVHADVYQVILHYEAFVNIPADMADSEAKAVWLAKKIPFARLAAQLVDEEPKVSIIDAGNFGIRSYVSGHEMCAPESDGERFVKNILTDTTLREIVLRTSLGEKQTWQDAMVDEAERLEWKVSHEDDSTEWEFERYSDAGRDFVVTIVGGTPDEVVHDLYDQWNSFDICEETYLWLDESGHGRNGAPYDMMDVYQDSVQCKAMLEELLTALRNLFANGNYK